jgi:hypothetical protein
MAGNFNTVTRLRPVLIGVGIGLVLGILADVFANPDPSKVQSPVVYDNPVSGRTGRFDRRGMPGIVFLPILGAFCGIAFLLAQSTRIAPRTPKPAPAAKDGEETRQRSRWAFGAVPLLKISDFPRVKRFLISKDKRVSDGAAAVNALGAKIERRKAGPVRRGVAGNPTLQVE